MVSEFDKVTEVLTKQLADAGLNADEARSELSAAQQELTAKRAELSAARKSHEEAAREQKRCGGSLTVSE